MLTPRDGGEPQRLLRFALHHGQAVEIALSPGLFSQLRSALNGNAVEICESQAPEVPTSDRAWQRMTAEEREAWLENAWEQHALARVKVSAKACDVTNHNFAARLKAADPVRYRKIFRERQSVMMHRGRHKEKASAKPLKPL